MHVLSFKPEVVLYVYMASCISVLLFNILFIFTDKHKGKKQAGRSLKYVGEISEQTRRLKEGEEPEETHFRRIGRDLKKVEKLEAFEDSLLEVKKREQEETMAEYLRYMRGVFLKLTDVYRKRDTIEQAYFAYLVGSLGIDRGRKNFDGLMDFLMDMVTSRDVNVRENALRAFYSIGNVEALLAAWRKLDDNEIYHSKKLLADGLLRFSGDRGQLARLLFGHRKEFVVQLVLPILQFIRFFSSEFQAEFLPILSGKNEDKEIQLEAIRYFRKYPYGPAKVILQNYVRYQEYVDWEFAAMAASALSCYPGEDTVLCLKEGLRALNWYVRLNCAEALIYGLGLSKLQLFDIYNGRDRYAREILNYVLEREEIRKKDREEGQRYV